MIVGGLSQQDDESLLTYLTAAVVFADSSSGLSPSEVAREFMSVRMPVEMEDIVRRRVAEAIRDAADELREQAALRMDEHGPHDARGVAIWDCASWVRLYAEARRITN